MAQKASSSTQISMSRAKFAEIKAVPGSGKTHALLMRLLYLLSNGVPADKILLLSHSTTAVEELRRRKRTKMQEQREVTSDLRQAGSANTNLAEVKIMTAHAFANSLIPKQTVLKEKQAQLLLSTAIKVVQQDCRKSLRARELSEIVYNRRMKLLDELGEQQNLKFVLSFLAVARAATLTLAKTAENPQFADLVPHLKALRVVRKKYAALKEQKGLIDYGDMLHQATDAIRARATVPYTHILVDEYQDCSPAQVQLLAALANLEGRSIMVFGDPGQAIYGFGGSCYTPLSSVLEGVQELSFPNSHRLTAKNAALASAIRQLPPDQAIQTKRQGTRPVLVTSSSEIGQAERIADDIEQLLEAGTPPEQIVVLGRIKALLHPVEQQLLTREQHSTRLQVRRDNKHVLRVLHLVHLVGRAEKSRQKITVEKLRLALPRLTVVDDEILKKASSAIKNAQRAPSLEGRYRLCGKVYLRLLGGIRSDRDRQHDVNRWEPLCRAYSSAKQMHDAVRAMGARAVFTGTIHAAKGMEWDHVFVVGATDGYLPIFHADGNKAGLAEERNLLYVAITRARETVRLYHAPCNHARSRQRFKKRSRFLPPSVLKHLQVE